MKNKIVSIILMGTLASLLSWAQGIRKPVCAGSWYDSNPDALSRQLDRCLLQAETTSPTEGIIGLVAPHAGYIYSGQIAAHAYRLVHGKDYDTVIIIGTAHHYGFRGCSIYPKGGYETPLGVAEIDETLASEISKVSGYKFIPKAHAEEHSVEMQVPFIQKVLPEAKIVPIVMGTPSKITILSLAAAFSKTLSGKKVLIVASTDLSHFFPKEKANTVDTETLSLMESMDTDTIIKKMEQRENIMCGGGPVAAVLLYAKQVGAPKVEILKYADSSQVGGDETRVVGYMAAAVYAGENATPSFSLSSDEKTSLLQIARETLERYVRNNEVYHPETDNPKFLSKRGAFVTLKKKGELRGCIGFIEPVLPLHQTIVQATIYAASKDTRFPPVSPSELKDIELEISVLTPFKKIDDPREVDVGKHGLIIAKGNRRGLLLPQVPVENRWSREMFLQQTCQKAGLPRDAWRSGAEIYTFEAIVFH
ncbi:MAG TPA: AmmeMemoRadiSam system protein B [Candidatus Heimdallarchaeota archaeon]|nr:AmmeMemoRadiSam system protein B [Candidatus Heimdallarchaeota archaeon]